MLDAAMNFWAKRKRPWQLFVFHDGYREMREFLLETITETPDFTSMLPNLRRIIYLYNDVGLGLLDRRSRRKQVKRETPQEGLVKGVEELEYETLHLYLKTEWRNDAE